MYLESKQANDNQCGTSTSTLLSQTTTGPITESIGCEPSRVFHGYFPYDKFDFKTGVILLKLSIPNFQIAQDALDPTGLIFQDVRKKSVQAYIKYKTYHDKKANASKLKERGYVYVLQACSKTCFRVFRWIEPYILEEASPHKIYLLRKFGTDKTQFLH